MATTAPKVTVIIPIKPCGMCPYNNMKIPILLNATPDPINTSLIKSDSFRNQTVYFLYYNEYFYQTAMSRFIKISHEKYRNECPPTSKFLLMYIKNQKNTSNGQRSQFNMCFLWKFQFLLRPFQHRR